MAIIWTEPIEHTHIGIREQRFTQHTSMYSPIILPVTFGELVTKEILDKRMDVIDAVSSRILFEGTVMELAFQRLAHSRLYVRCVDCDARIGGK